LTILRSSFFGGFGGAVGADAEEVGGGEFAFSTLAEDARVIWLRRRYCFCCLRVNELVVVVVELNWLVNDCVANIMVSLLKKKSASARAFTKNFCGEKANSLSFNGDTSVGRVENFFFYVAIWSSNFLYLDFL